jgi:hypothetical protein
VGHSRRRAEYDMAADQEIIIAVRDAFGAEPRPAHFTNHSHCCECAEHDGLLSSRDPDGLKLEDVNNAGWDPICFTTPEGFKYYLPALVRLALESAASGGWYLPQLLFHLIADGPQTRRVACCTRAQRRAIVGFLWHMVESRSELIVEYRIEEELERAIGIWSEGAA